MSRTNKNRLANKLQNYFNRTANFYQERKIFMSKKEIQAIETQLATHEIFGQVRFIQTENGEIYFAAVDVCKILGIKNSRQAVSRLDEDEKAIFNIGYSEELEYRHFNIRYSEKPGNPNLTFVNEPGLYRLIFSSRKKSAKEFQRWVYHEVLPSIRKYGYYSLEDDRRNWTGDQWLEYYQDLKKKLPYMTNEEKLALAEDPDILVWQRMNGEVKVKICF